MTMNPVLEFLQSNDGYSFNEGVAVLLAYSTNANVNNIITKRRDRKALHMELVRLAHIPNLRQLPGVSTPAITAKKEQGNGTEKETEKDKQRTPVVRIEKKESPTVTQLDLERHKQYDPDKLPPQLKDLWLKNQEEFRELKYCHAQMKLANSDAGRAEWREKIIDLRDSLTERWKLFDYEIENLAKKESQTQGEEQYNPVNHRSNITKALKAESWSDERKIKVQHWVDELINHGYSFKPETEQKLKDRGITIPG